MNAESSPSRAQKPAPEAGSAPASQGEPADPEPRQSRAPTLLIEIVEDAGDWSLFGDEDARHAIIAEAGRAVACADAPASRLPCSPAGAVAVVALSDDEQVAALNTQYRGKAKPTNVLSFPAGASPATADDAQPLALGDIVLAVETIAAEATDLGIAPQDHLRHLIVHGLLHLLGYDHVDPVEAGEMEALETRILAAIGVADPYAGSTPIDAQDG